MKIKTIWIWLAAIAALLTLMHLLALHAEAADRKMHFVYDGDTTAAAWPNRFFRWNVLVDQVYGDMTEREVRLDSAQLSDGQVYVALRIPYKSTESYWPLVVANPADTVFVEVRARRVSRDTVHVQAFDIDRYPNYTDTSWVYVLTFLLRRP